MPGRDGTGPMGMGHMTGRGAGLCSYPAFGGRFQNRAFTGYGCQRGFLRQYYETGIPGYLRSNYSGNTPNEDERAYLTYQETMLYQQLKLVKGRLVELNDTDE
jgi:hypothetical protein